MHFCDVAFSWKPPPKTFLPKCALYTFVDGCIDAAGLLDFLVALGEERTKQRLQKRALLRALKWIDTAIEAVLPKLLDTGEET
jgi:hypothetical protein